MSRSTKDPDPSRPIHYEGDCYSAHVHVYSRMYASQAETALIGQCIEPPVDEAALDADAVPLGGFVGEWLEHGITITFPDGRQHYGYGGDFGEEVHDGNFVTDGLVHPDRNPRPGLLDSKKVNEPLRITVAADWSAAPSATARTSRIPRRSASGTR